MKKRQKINGDKNFREKKRKFLRFSSFPFCPTPKIENLETSEIVFLPQILTVVVTSDAKMTKN